MGRNPTFSLGMLKLPNIWDFSAVGSAGRVEGAEGGCLQLSPCLPPSDVKGVSEECLPPAPGTGGAEIPPRTSAGTAKGSIFTCDKIRDRKVVIYLPSMCRCFSGFLGRRSLSTPTPPNSIFSPASHAPPLYPPLD